MGHAETVRNALGRQRRGGSQATLGWRWKSGNWWAVSHRSAGTRLAPSSPAPALYPARLDPDKAVWPQNGYGCPNPVQGCMRSAKPTGRWKVRPLLPA
jgi:hypothetical protein